MYAIIETGGKQYRVEKDDVVYIEKIEAGAGDEVVFDKVLAIGGDEGVKVGAPYVEGAKVGGVVEKQGKAKKIRVFTYRSKKCSKRCLGHRQPYTKVVIGAIEG